MGQYDDIINMPHHVSSTRPQMPRENRAAQFSPFAALTGLEESIEETARLVDERIELGDNAIAFLEMKLSILRDNMALEPNIVVTYFLPDARKEGGAYVTATGKVKKIDDFERVIVMTHGERIVIHDIIDIQGDLFKDIV